MKFSPSIFDVIAACLPKQGYVLEIGCGSGELLRRLSRSSRCVFFGMDPDPNLVKQAAGAGLPVKAGRGEEIPYGRNYFDAVVMECVFSLCDSRQTVHELCRVLRPGGIAVIADLYSNICDLTLRHSPMLKHLYRPETMNCLFRPAMELKSYGDYTKELRAMFFQMMLERKLCGCVGISDVPVLKEARVGYGLWVWRKPNIGGGLV